MQEVARDTREDNVLPLKESQSAAGQTEEARTATTAPLDAAQMQTFEDDGRGAGRPAPQARPVGQG